MSSVKGKGVAVITAVGGGVAFWLGGLDPLLTALLILMGLDYVTGLFCGYYHRELSSAVGFRGIVRKVFLLIVVAVAFIIQWATEHQFPLREMVVVFFIANESLSIVENAASVGLPIPKKLREVLIQLREENNEE